MTTEPTKRHGKEDPEAEKMAILANATAFALEQFNQAKDHGLVYHHFGLSRRILQNLDRILTDQPLAPRQELCARLGAWFYPASFLEQYETPKQGAELLIRQFFQQHYPEEQVFLQEALACILLAYPPISGSPNPATAALSDAILGYEMGVSFFELAPYLRLEIDLKTQRSYSDFEWSQFLMQRLMSTHFFTVYGQEFYAPLLAEHILRQKEDLLKHQRQFAKKKKVPELRTFNNIERKIPNSGNQTFFRTNYRNHINLSAIADNKANIMISVNAILISVLISLISYSSITETKPIVLMPIIIFMVTGLSSLIFAVLSARPKVTSVNHNQSDPEIRKRNAVFFGNFVQMPLEEYEQAVDSMLRDGELLYGNMTRDLYYLGKVLDKKYRFLTLSYNIFMMGFAATVITFLIAILT